MAPRAERDLIARVKRTIARRKLLPPATPVLVAVSGGPDSTALAHALATIASEAPRRASDPEPPRLAGLAHFHHGLRGADADADLTAAEALAGTLGVPLFVERIAPGALEAERRRGRGSLEAVARRARYRFLERAAGEAGASGVAVGHTATDQAETVLHRLVRGAGLAGLAGMPARRRIACGSGVRIVRPLIDASRAAIVAFLAAKGLEARRDATNHDDRFTRSRVRHELLPLLRERFNPSIERALLRTARAARRARRAVERPARRLLDGADRDLASAVEGAEVSVPLAELRSAPPAVRDAALARLIAALAPDRVSAGAVAGLAAIVAASEDVRRHGRRVDLPGGVVAERRRDELFLGRPSRAPDLEEDGA